MENSASEESEATAVTETVAPLISCLPAVSTRVPFTDPRILACEKAGKQAYNPINNRKTLFLIAIF
jgi:hypothetical protein